MLLSRLAASALLLAMPASLPFAAGSAQAASFDCAKAGTPFEHAICDFPEEGIRFGS